MYFIPPHHRYFVEKILSGDTFLSYVDDSGQKWVCVFDFLPSRNFDDLYKSLLEEYDISCSEVFIKKSSLVCHEEDYDGSGRYQVMNSFALRNASKIERAYFSDMDVELDSLYISEDNFEKLKSRIVDEYESLDNVEFKRLYFEIDFDDEWGYLISEYGTMKVKRVHNGDETWQYLLLEYFYKSTPRSRTAVDELYASLSGDGETDLVPNSVKRRFKDVVKNLNEKADAVWGESILEYQNSAVSPV